MFDFLLENYEFLVIPIVAAIVGWGTNWIAIQLTFYPIEPIGKPPYFGWVGIIPSKAEKMGRISTRSVLSKLGSLREVFEAMEPEKISSHVVQAMEPQIEEYVDSVMREDNPTVWELTPTTAKMVIYGLVKHKLPSTVDAVTDDVRENIEEMIDLEWTVVQKLEQDKELTNRIFLECGAEEFKFIINSGFFFGFFLGVIQAIIWFFALRAAGGSTDQVWWLLPLFGILVGYLTNWLALRVIFSPIEPVKVGPWNIQGLFLKRQDEVAAIWTSIVTSEILTVQNIIDSMLHGPRAHRTQRVIRHHVRKMTDEVLGPMKYIAQGALGVKGFSEMKEHSADAAIELSMEAFEDPVFNASRAKIVQEMMEDRMKELSSEEFQMLLRPAFQEDELKLILLGAVLGGIAGLIQVYTLF